MWLSSLRAAIIFIICSANLSAVSPSMEAKKCEKQNIVRVGDWAASEVMIMVQKLHIVKDLALIVLKK